MLLNLPLDVVNLVLEKMEPKDLLRSRKVCRTLRTTVDKFGVSFWKISCHVCKDLIYIAFDYDSCQYVSAANNYGFPTDDEQKRYYGEDFVEIAFQDLKIVLKHVSRLCFTNDDSIDNTTCFINLLKSEECIKAQEIEFTRIPFNAVVSILPIFDSQALDYMVLLFAKSDPIEQFERITYLDQWKNAKNLRLYVSKLETSMLNMFHFENFSIGKMSNFPVEMAVKIRDDLITKSTFHSCSIEFDTSNSNPIDIAKTFKPEYNGGNKFNFEYSNNLYKFRIKYDFALFILKLRPSHETYSHIFD